MTTAVRSAGGAAAARRPRAHQRVRRLRAAGVAVWLDSIARDLLEGGRFEELVESYGITGVTSNPTIFERAINSSGAYDDQLRRLGPIDPREAFLELATGDVRRAADVLRPVHEASKGEDGFVSFQCTPAVAHHAEATIAQALGLRARIDRPNAMIKVPATDAAARAVEELTAAGVNVNVTLLFSLGRYDEVIEAYLGGLERRVAQGLPLDVVSSVASFFVSRVDAKADELLPPGSRLRGRVGVRNALRAYDLHRRRFRGPRWERLRAHGARVQRPLWASTATKSPELRDVFYVEELATPGAINTMTEHTLLAFADHGEVHEPRPVEPELELGFVTAQLEREGVEAFQASYANVMRVLAEKLA